MTLESKSTVQKFKIAEKVDRIVEKEAFLSLKDHREDFRTNPKYRLLNPSKLELEKFSKTTLKKINSNYKNQLAVNQWRNSLNVIPYHTKITKQVVTNENFENSR